MEYAECVLPVASSAVLDWFELVARVDTARAKDAEGGEGGRGGYANPLMEISEVVLQEYEEAMKGAGGGWD